MNMVYLYIHVMIFQKCELKPSTLPLIMAINSSKSIMPSPLPDWDHRHNLFGCQWEELLLFRYSFAGVLLCLSDVICMTSQWTKLYQVAIHFHHQVCNCFESKCIFHFTALQHLMPALEKTARTTYHCEIPRNETTGLAKHHKMYPASWMWPFHTFSILFLGFYIVISYNFM